MTFTKVTEGSYEGMYTIQDAGGKYLYAASSSSNHLKGGAAAESENYYWTVECNDGAYSIVASMSSNRSVMQFNPNNGTPLFSCYSSASQSPVKLYSYSMVKADTTPRITVKDTEYNVSADDETLEFSYTTKNIDGTPTVSVADGATMMNVEADAEAGIVTVIFDANAEEEEKTATLVLSYEGAKPVSVTITQAAKAAQGGDDTEKVWTLVTDASTLTAGDKLAIVSTSKGKIAGSLSSSYLTSIDVSIANNEFTSLPSGAVEFTLGGASGAWTLAGSDGKLLGATAVKKLAWGSGTTTWSISIDGSGNATIQNGTSSFGRFLYNNSSPRFTTYTSNASSSMLLPQIYRYE